MEGSDRIENLLALLLIENLKGSLKDKALKLSLAGFTNAEIADLLNKKPQDIASSLYQARKAERK